MLRPTVLTVPRGLHPGAWWLWALALATAASRTTNPLLLGLLLAVAGHVVVARRTDAPWARAFVVFLKLGLVVVAIRVVAQVLLGHHGDGITLVTLPVLPLPDWAAGVEIGGPITAEASLAALVEGMRLAAVLACIGAANALANPKRLLAAMPGALYEVGVAVVVALSFAPSLVASVTRIRAARRLRGRPDRGLRGMISVALPVLEDALERSLDLAAAMDSRGYGRQAPVSRAARRTTATLILAGLACWTPAGRRCSGCPRCWPGSRLPWQDCTWPADGRSAAATDPIRGACRSGSRPAPVSLRPPRSSWPPRSIPWAWSSRSRRWAGRACPCWLLRGCCLRSFRPG